jgi:pimeloyl-ACP methyl ester carboxylesterase
VAADLADGAHNALIGELEALVREHPFRERLWGQLMVALYQSGRQADALAAYERARVLLRDELGLEPGGELRRLERAVLDHDASLDASPAGSPEEAGNGTSDADPSKDVTRSPVRYARAPDGVHVAYQIVGNGPVDVLAVPGFVSHLDMWWDAPTDRLARRLASFSRLILFDKRGMGLSDRPPAIDVEQWVQDTEAVQDAAGSQRAVILGISAGAPTAALFAASHPERTRALVLYGGYPRFTTGDGYELGFEPDVVESFINHMEANWGTGVGVSTLAPSRAADPTARAYWARCQTLSASPGAAAEFMRALARIDIRHALPAIAVPTLILHAARDANTPVEGARLMRDLIPHATLVELDTDIHLIWLSDVVEVITQEIEHFVARSLPATETDRVLVTVLGIRPPVRGHYRQARIDEIVERFRGRPHPAGLVTFDGPAQAIRCGRALLDPVAGVGSIGVGVHSGECVVAPDGLRGVAIEVAEQLANSAPAGELLVSQTIRDLLAGAELGLQPRGRRSFTGVPGEWDVFAVAAGV